MFGSIPCLFKDGVLDGQWPKETTRFYMQMYGLPVSICKGVMYRWDKDKWVECNEKSDVEYVDARHCSEATAFIAQKEKLEDGYYTLVGLTTDNPYGFRHPMLVPFDLSEIEYDRELTIEAVREFLMFQPNIFGLLVYCEGRRAYVNRYDVGLKFRYEGSDGEAVPGVRSGNNGEQACVDLDKGKGKVLLP